LEQFDRLLDEVNASNPSTAISQKLYAALEDLLVTTTSIEINDTLVEVELTPRICEITEKWNTMRRNLGL
jgi:hypothetical protein